MRAIHLVSKLEGLPREWMWRLCNVGLGLEQEKWGLRKGCLLIRQSALGSSIVAIVSGHTSGELVVGQWPVHGRDHPPGLKETQFTIEREKAPLLENRISKE